MTSEQQAAYVFAQAVCAFGELLALPTYPHATAAERAKEVERIISAYGIHQNAVLSLYRGYTP